MAGPSTKPTPKAAPSRPMRRGRSLPAAMSPTAACATDKAATRRAVDDPTGEQHPQRTRRAGDEAADGGADQRDHDDRLATDAIADSRPSSGAHSELGQREAGEQQADRQARGAVPLGVATEDRHDDAEPDEIERDRGPDRPVPLGHGVRSRFATTPRSIGSSADSVATPSPVLRTSACASRATRAMRNPSRGESTR